MANLEALPPEFSESVTGIPYFLDYTSGIGLASVQHPPPLTGHRAVLHLDVVHASQSALPYIHEPVYADQVKLGEQLRMEMLARQPHRMYQLGHGVMRFHNHKRLTGIGQSRQSDLPAFVAFDDVANGRPEDRWSTAVELRRAGFFGTTPRVRHVEDLDGLRLPADAPDYLQLYPPVPLRREGELTREEVGKRLGIDHDAFFSRLLYVNRTILPVLRRTDQGPTSVYGQYFDSEQVEAIRATVANLRPELIESDARTTVVPYPRRDKVVRRALPVLLPPSTAEVRAVPEQSPQRTDTSGADSPEAAEQANKVSLGDIAEAFGLSIQQAMRHLRAIPGVQAILDEIDWSPIFTESARQARGIELGPSRAERLVRSIALQRLAANPDYKFGIRQIALLLGRTVEEVTAHMYATGRLKDLSAIDEVGFSRATFRIVKSELQ